MDGVVGQLSDINNGLTICSGVVKNGAAHTNYSISFPITYTNICRVVVSGQSSNYNANCCGGVHIVNIYLSKFEVTTQEINASYIGAIVYLAIGT